ncbi:uncharacterized protein LOC107615856 [Arachis ipaensis]|uniref:uncharacterized protein LOC107615856 n=1 Tax=Arachis ipaensis TaxID=130454 RepID=UPI0007AF56F6|nr:uncharacterized protein LOC107615856 [Arachis ipaensis]XP_025678773.1 uncharacterized protein LOC112778691 [Arachis hypogaea]
MDQITNFLENSKLPEDEKATKVIWREAAKYAIVQGQLFKRGLNQPLLKCLRPDQTDYVLSEVHEGCCGHHIGGKVEAEPLANILSVNCQKFMWRQMIPRFGIPEVVISDNGTQFTDKRFGEFLTGLVIKQRFSSVEHPQTNGQVEAVNKVSLQGLKKRLDQKKGGWADKLASVFWSYRTTPQSSTERRPSDLPMGSMR